MCNDYRLLTGAATLFADFSELKIKIRFPEGKPNIEARARISRSQTKRRWCVRLSIAVAAASNG
jgi:hypothetical protein